MYNTALPSEIFLNHIPKSCTCTLYAEISFCILYIKLQLLIAIHDTIDSPTLVDLIEKWTHLNTFKRRITRFLVCIFFATQ